MNIPKKAYFHLPGLFEFYELYSLFLPVFYEHRDFFYDWCEIGSIYGAPDGCLWGGGRVENGTAEPEDVLKLLEKYGISARLTFSNSLLLPSHLEDKKCNRLCRLFESRGNGRNGIIIHSDLLLDYVKRNYPGLYPVSSTTKVLLEFSDLEKELKKDEFKYVVPDFRLNKDFPNLSKLSQEKKNKLEFLCNECCSFDCKNRKQCYENVSRLNLDMDVVDYKCTSDTKEAGYSFSKAMKNPSFISDYDIVNTYLPMGISNYKIEGRGLGSALILEFLLYYLTKTEYRINVREMIYLDNMLDLF